MFPQRNNADILLELSTFQMKKIYFEIWKCIRNENNLKSSNGEDIKFNKFY